jgi:hypothetical protein
VAILAKLSKWELVLSALFTVTLLFVQAQVREDGIAYYGVARSLIVDHNLQFRNDWNPTNTPSILGKDQFGRPVTLYVSKTGHLPVHSSIGASLLWMPFLAVTHGVVRILDHMGAHISANGFSRPYIITLAGATSLYALAGLLLSFRIAARFVEERWAFLATMALWLASSLPAYIYVDPAWSHAHSVFVVALFLWYWIRTRESRTPAQWFLLGLISGVMVEVYFPNVVVASVIVVEIVWRWFSGARNSSTLPTLGAQARDYSLYAIAVLIALLPTFVIRTILLGGPLATGAYGNEGWNWTSPHLLQVLFSPSQGLLTTTPIVILAIAGLVLLARRDAIFGTGLLAAFVGFCAIIAVYPFWNLGPSFGNRYFISLTPAFITGLALLLSELALLWGDRAAFSRRAWIVVAMLIVWNVGLVFQWSVGLMPDVGRVYWSEILYNQFRIVPGQAIRALCSRFSPHSNEADEVGSSPPSSL